MTPQQIAEARRLADALDREAQEAQAKDGHGSSLRAYAAGWLRTLAAQAAQERPAVIDAVLNTPEPDRWVDCGEVRPLPMFHFSTLMQYGHRCADAAAPAVDVEALMALADEYAATMQDAGANQNSDFADRRRDGCRQEQEAHDGPRAALRAALEGLKA